MKANQQALRNDENAQVGIGTMIVFIATILVAAVAAGVLINVSGGLQSKAVATGTDATENVASTMQVQSAFGNVSSSTGLIVNVTIFLQLGAGSEAVNLDDVTIQYSDGSSLATVNGTSTEVEGDGDSVLEAGEYWKMQFDADRNPNTDTPLGWDESQKVHLELVPAVGNSAVLSFTTPSAFGSNQYVKLF